MTKRQQNKLDKEIEAIVRRRCCGLTIDIMDIHKVFKAGYAASMIEGGDIEAAVVACYTELAK